MFLQILDTTLRDGAQGAGVEFSPDDKLRVIHELDSLGVSYIEAGMITSRRTRNFSHSSEKCTSITQSSACSAVP